jgi:hypothetical protein
MMQARRQVTDGWCRRRMQGNGRGGSRMADHDEQARLQIARAPKRKRGWCGSVATEEAAPPQRSWELVRKFLEALGRCRAVGRAVRAARMGYAGG